MPVAQALTSGLNAGTNFANLQRQRKRDAFDQQQKQVENYNSIVGTLADSLEKTKAAAELQLSQTTDAKKREQIINQYSELFKQTTSNAARAGETAASRGLPVNPVVQQGRLAPFENLRDLTAEIAQQAAQKASEAGQVAGAKATATQPSKIALESQKQETVQKQFVNESGETVTQLKDGTFTDTQGNVITEVSRLNGLRNIPTTSTQNINTTDLTTRVKGDLQTGVINDSDRIARLKVIREQIDSNSSFLTVGGKSLSAGLNLLDKAGIPIPDAGEEFLVEQTRFVRDSIENINNYIKEITGAQMSEKEATRLRLAQPDPGEGVFGGDGPIKFKAKLEGALDAGTLAQARKAYFLEKGIIHDFEAELEKGDRAIEPPISLSGMKQIINDKGREEALIIRANNPEMPIEDVLDLARSNVQRRFGMTQ